MLLEHVLLLDGSGILLLSHLVVLLVALGRVLNEVSIGARLDAAVAVRVGRHAITRRRNGLTLVSIVELLALYKREKF